MKRLLLAILFLLPAAGIAAVPGLISYQGRVLDSAGNPVGAGTPVNRTVIFRIWDHPSNTLEANLMYSEQQTVTIADGEFSVLVGQGTATTLESFGFAESGPPASIGDAFNGATRYLGVTVAANATIALTDNEITPRQQIVSSAFALRALKAETIIDSAVGTGAIAAASVTLEKMAASSVNANTIVDGSIGTVELTDGSVTLAKMAENSVDGGKLVDGSVGTNDLANNSVNSAKIADGSIVAADLANGSVTKAKLGSDVGIWGVAGTSPWKTVYLNTSGADRFGINTTAAAAPLHVNDGFYQFNNYTRLLRNDGLLTDGGYYQTISIIASGFVKAEAFAVASDARFKKVLGRSDGAKDLELLGQIEVTDYKAIDQLARGPRQHKKVIAQQVEEVFPQAVSKSKDVIPDLFKEARCEGGWVKLATDLKPGERVRMLAEGADEVFKVLEVKSGRFRVDWKGEDAPVFVYGREVDDFRMVDYDALSMLNVSATQELARKVEQQETELSALRAELSKLRKENTALSGTVTDLKERDDAREARLAAIEKRLGSPDQPAVRTIPVKTVAAAE